ncbi:carnosine N-methyltransferase-like [Iris pallida]|uniref:carnosine N-methyltransferase n=1 Tax=Iris pallida TaxID=29817 RepID=A0AAX6HZT7_IRIPA|nr:carnosine N-methyltransferase-like [Iris pallida]
MEEERSYFSSRMEEALEIKSLRRIISAYLNYAEAAEEDVRRYEKSFRKLPPAHKALLSHLPLKYQRLRRCISMNSFFIINMLQAFEPPLDMSQNFDIDESENVENLGSSHIQSKTDQNPEINNCRGQPILISGNDASGPESSRFRLESAGMCKPLRSNDKEEFDFCRYQQEMREEKSSMSNLGEPVISDNQSELCKCEGDDDKVTADTVLRCCNSTSNGSDRSASHDWMDPTFQLNVPLVDVDKVRCIIRNIVRDWAPEGQKERDQCYKPILEELSRLFPVRCKERPPSCLVPGAGLGRLALEISCLGFESQGNEFSYYMMICSSFILNHTQVAGEWTIHPWVHSNCNSLSDDDQLRPVSFPDIHPASAGITEGFSMCGGDFVEVYNDVNQEASWDVVVTCFFLDTAHNIVEYIEIISKIVRDGGVWINLGPLLYHFADTYGPDDDMSVEISLEDLKNIAFHYGFELEMEKIVETTYTANPRSMMRNHYFAAFWTMRKKPKS